MRGGGGGGWGAGRGRRGGGASFLQRGVSQCEKVCVCGKGEEIKRKRVLKLFLAHVRFRGEGFTVQYLAYLT